MTTPSPSSSEFDFHLNRPGALIAALPAVLGFVPEFSLVLVTVNRGELGCVLRADLADDMTERVAHLVAVAATTGPDAVIAVMVDDHSRDCRACDDRYRDLASVLDEAFAVEGIELYAAHVVDKVAVGLPTAGGATTLYALAAGEYAERAEALWALLARTLPDPWRAERLSLLAFRLRAR
ncbi:hypothetical protein BN970_05299 [Mycolicibacterium conceptionense]|uniref:DUF4192 domain-containing protein n=1 Tax=Mycolicibacterium conceptionense TaxID=451644 RepID=A0A0U1DT91_9MYCO|nr:hypothetical protein BN970_05299 [Mycolicibacterium conceptionense]